MQQTQKNTVGQRIVMNMPDSLFNRMEDYRILKRMRLNTSLPKTSEAIIDLMVLGLVKLEEMIDKSKNSPLHKISTDESFQELITKLEEFKGK